MAHEPGETRYPLLNQLDRVTALRVPAWIDGLQGARMFLTGGTGLIGRWLLEGLWWAHLRHGWRGNVHVLTRKPQTFAATATELACQPWLTLVPGDVATFDFPKAPVTHVVHLASLADNTASDVEEHRQVFLTCVEGTRRTLQLAERDASRYFYASSAAVYGKRLFDGVPISESRLPLHDVSDPACAYGFGKQVGEYLCALATLRGQTQTVVGRIFTVAGPGMERGRGFALPEFVRMALGGGPIRVRGDGSPVRTYLHATDIVDWIWTMLLRGTPGTAYNVGGDEPVNMGELAARISQCIHPPSAVEILGVRAQGAPVHCMIPDIELATKSLGLEVRVPLAGVIESMLSQERLSGDPHVPG